MNDEGNQKSSNGSPDVDRLRVLIIGGYGTFGGRLAELLAGEHRLTLLISGRSQKKAAAFCTQVTQNDGALLVPERVDRDGDLARVLTELKPDLVVDASGPFQIYSDSESDPYRVVRACINGRVPYIDLADSSVFVGGIDALDDEARAADVFVLSGVSSFPVLTCAVVRAMIAEGLQPATLVAGIAPSPYAGVGENVVRAIAAYSGQPVSIRRDGRESTAYPLTESINHAICVGGHRPLRPIRFSLVDVPDLQICPRVWPDLRSVWVGAGPVPEILHRLLNGLAHLVKWKVLPTIAPLAVLMHRVMNSVRWGPHRGGMFVRATEEEGDDAARTAVWSLVAEGDDGPYIPSMGAAAIVQFLLDGAPPRSGARAAHTELELAHYERFFLNREIVSSLEITDSRTARLPLYARMLGAAWHNLPSSLQVLHDVRERHTYSGIADVEGAKGLVARGVARVFGFPSSAEAVPVEVTLERQGSGELWTRDFDGQTFHSTQDVGQGRFEGLLVERFGPFTFGLAVIVRDQKLRLELERWTLLGLPLPKFLAPGCDAVEADENGRFTFSVRISLPLVGTLVHYRGWLESVRETDPEMH